MPEAAPTILSSETNEWFRRAEETLARELDDAGAWLRLVQKGIGLRRRWDVAADPFEQRHRLVSLLVRVQTACHGAVVARAEAAARDHGELDMGRASLIDSVLAELADSDTYLAGLLNDTTTAPELVARAVEAFRDDLHWLATLVAVLDGSAPPDLVSRVLAEQEAIERAMGDGEEAVERTHGAGQGGGRGPVPEVLHELRCTARSLRSAALEQRVWALLAAEPPGGHPGWYERWRAASRLVVHSDAAPGRPRPSNTAARGASACGSNDAVYDALFAYRNETADAWQQRVAELDADERQHALECAAEELMDTASDALTFLEDLPPAEEVRTLEVLRDDLAVCRSAVARAQSELDSPQLDRLQRKLRRRSSAVQAELQERQLAWRMERRFGHSAVAALERLIFVLLLLFVGLLVIEGPLIRWEAAQGWSGSAGSGETAPGPVEATLAWIDLVICLVFLGEFSLKLVMVSGRWRYLGRHWLTGLLPALPFGFFAYATHHAVLAGYAEEFVLLRGLRYLRLPRMVRWLRIARPMVRTGRLVGFVLRTGDRLVRQLAPVLNRNLVLFERADIEVEEPEYRVALAGLREQFIYRAGEVRGRLDAASRWRLARDRMQDLASTLEAAPVGVVTLGATVDVASSREIPLESVIARLLTATPAQVAERIGPRLAEQLTRWCRAFDVPLVRRLPMLQRFVEAGRLRDPCESAARVANQLGLHLKRGLERVYWCADLYGTLTAPQLVDALGDWLVKGTARPTRRLLLLGGSFLLVSYLASLMPVGALQQLSDLLGKFVAGSLIVVGLLCLVPLSLGIWFRRIAGQATEFYDQVAEAQYLTATKQLKQRIAERQTPVLEKRVIGPELCLLGRAAQPLCGDEPIAIEQRRRVRETVDRLWHDYVDGAPFHRTDTKTTTQLLGNLVLVSLRESRLSYSRGEQKRLRRLDLDRDRGSFTGPYLWFHFISRSLAQHTAKLVVDYNAHAIPLSRAGVAGDDEVADYAHWVAERTGVAAGAARLPEPFRGRAVGGALPNTAATAQPAHKMRFQGNDFTAQHFLSADAALQQDICRRYGEPVAALVRRDRRDNVRRVFRSFPLHHWPKEKRTFNPLMLYQRHLDGGRILLVPFKTLAWGCVACWHGVRLVARVVGDVLNPVEVMLSGLRDADPFAVAVRKIHRMRKPVFLECLRMRARFDPEYLGIALPGVEQTGGSGPMSGRTTDAPINEDLDRIEAGLRVREEFRSLAAQRRRQVHDFARWLERLDWNVETAKPQNAPEAETVTHSALRTPRSSFESPCFSPESLRAMTVAYCVDYRNLRTRLEATKTLEHALDEMVLLRGKMASKRGTRLRRVTAGIVALLAPRPRLSSKRLRRLFAQPAFARFTGEQRRWCCNLLRQQRGPHRKALRRLIGRGTPADPVDDARRKLLGVARDPSTWSQQMLVLRTVQTMTVLDLQTYCELANELGEYHGPTAANASGGPWVHR